MIKRIGPAFLVVLLFMGTALADESPSDRDYRAAHALVQARKYEQALALYQKALQTPPGSVSHGDIQSRIGDTYFKMNEYGQALRAYGSAIEDPKLADKAQTQYWIGFCSFLVGRDAEAVAELLKVPRLYPDAKAWGSTAWYWAGRASERMGKKEQAAEYYRKAAGANGKTTQGRFARKKAEAVSDPKAKSQASNNK
jgi:tetratricopeptide (TPR) repeat protein